MLDDGLANVGGSRKIGQLQRKMRASACLVHYNHNLAIPWGDGIKRCSKHIIRNDLKYMGTFIEICIFFELCPLYDMPSTIQVTSG